MKREILLVALLAAGTLAGVERASAQPAGGFARPAPSGVPDEPRTFDTLAGPLRVSTYVRGLDRPWSIAWLPNGDMLVTEKPGRLRIVRNGVLDPTPISGTPAQIWTQGQAGLMEVSPHPNFEQNRTLYLTYSKPGEAGKGNTTALMRARLEGHALVDARDIFVADAWREANQHFGSKIAWGRDGMLYMTIGERNDRNRAQDTTQHAGKLLRLRDDGTVPPDNPFVGKPGVRPEIYSYGHRNAQGLAVHPETGEIWLTEHGPQGGDELNLVKPGLNYGWPVATYGREYNGNYINPPHRDGMEAPATVWVPSIGISGLVIYSGDRIPGWRHNMFVGGLSGQQVARVAFTAGGVQGREMLFNELRLRIRDVRQGPDGYLYLAVDSPSGAILKVEPAAAAATTSAQR